MTGHTEAQEVMAEHHVQARQYREGKSTFAFLLGMLMRKLPDAHPDDLEYAMRDALDCDVCFCHSQPNPPAGGLVVCGEHVFSTQTQCLHSRVTS